MDATKVYWGNAWKRKWKQFEGGIRLYGGYKGLHRGYVGITEKKMEATM